MNKVYIVSAKRTPVGSFLGSLSNLSPSDLASIVIKDILNTNNLDPNLIDEVIIGNVLSAGHSQGIARQSSIKANIPFTVPAYSVNIICGSGMKAVFNAYQSIKSGESNLVISGGTESMSQAPLLLSNKYRTGIKMGKSEVNDHLILDGLTDAFHNIHMGVTAENIAATFNITREEQDHFALSSQKKAIQAIDSCRFKDEIVPIIINTKDGDITIDRDEYPNRNTSLKKLSTLKTPFKENGTVTAGNSSGLNDGASILLIASEKSLVKYDLVPLAEIISIGQGGVDPLYMGLGPIPAISNALSKTSLNITDIDLFEINEAFASQSIAVIKELSLKYNISYKSLLNKTNLNGGAIALGHPIGASGSRILTTLLHEMKKQSHHYGLATLCIGGGMGVAIIIKNIK